MGIEGTYYYSCEEIAKTAQSYAEGLGYKAKLVKNGTVFELIVKRVSIKAKLN